MSHADSYKDNPIIAFRNSQPKPPISTHDIWHTTFCGVPAVQAWEDLMLWENFLNLADPHTLIEIGTFLGGLSLFLHFQAYSRDCTFVTVDWQEFADFKSEDSPLWISGVAAEFIHEDVWRPEFQHDLQNMITADSPAVLFCDGGNKPLEMRTFVPFLKPGDFVAVHDWGNEIGPDDIAPVLGMLEPVMLEDCENLKSLTRFWKRI